MHVLVENSFTLCHCANRRMLPKLFSKWILSRKVGFVRKSTYYICFIFNSLLSLTLSGGELHFGSNVRLPLSNREFDLSQLATWTGDLDHSFTELDCPESLSTMKSIYSHCIFSAIVAKFGSSFLQRYRHSLSLKTEENSYLKCFIWKRKQTRGSLVVSQYFHLNIEVQGYKNNWWFFCFMERDQ